MTTVHLPLLKAHTQEVRIVLSTSKSIHNRLLILQHLYRPNMQIEEDVIADDVRVLQNILNHATSEVNAQDAGTAYRFLTAYLSIAKPQQRFSLQGEKRMHNRPVGSLVTWLNGLGAHIQYAGKEGYPPLIIHSRPMLGGLIRVQQKQMSSQFLSALAMIGPAMTHGLTLNVPQNMHSKPYWDMTLQCMDRVGVPPQNPSEGVYVFAHQEANRQPERIRVEKDWSGASFFIVLALLNRSVKVFLEGLQMDSMQGDAHFLQHFAQEVGLVLVQEEKGVRVHNSEAKPVDMWPEYWDFSNNPDLSLNCMVLFALLGKLCRITGLESLQYKESDRVVALRKELNKMGANIVKQGEEWVVTPVDFTLFTNASPFTFFSHSDHRIAMALSLVAFIHPVIIQDAACVSKSFPGFWTQLKPFFDA